MMQEQYKRFYFKDIQAVVMQRTGRRQAIAMVWMALLLLLGGIALTVHGPPFVSGTLAALCALFLAVHLIMGPCCAVYLQTAVQMEKLSCLTRIRKACKTLDRIRAKAEEAQGPFSVESIAPARASGVQAASVQAVAADFGGLPPKLRAGAAESFNPLLHWILFGLLSAFALLRCAQLWLRMAPLAALDLFGLSVTLVLAIVALVHWHAQVKGSLLAAVSWSTLVFTIIQGTAEYAFFIAAALRHPGIARNNWELLKLSLDLQMNGHPLIRGFAIGIAAASVLLAVLGLAGTLAQGHGRPARSSWSPAT